MSATTVAATSSVPEYCKVAGTADQTIGFEVRLPTSWNGKLHYSGAGGFAGEIVPVDANALRKGFVNVTSDSGHVGKPPADIPLPWLDASWALNNPRAMENYGHAAIPKVMTAARAVIERRYGQPPTKSYFEGCSNGGRQALMSAQRYPELFDGIIAKSPAVNISGLALGFNRNVKAFAVPGSELSTAKVNTLSKAVLAACDTLDGAADGIVSNPSACAFNPTVLRCPGGADTSDSCLSDAQLGAIQAITTDFSLADGTLLNAGVPLSGNEADTGELARWYGAANAAAVPPVRSSATGIFSEGFIRYMLLNDPTVDAFAFQPDNHVAAITAVSSILNPTDPNLSRFKDRGGKLIMWHGGADSGLSPQTAIRYHSQMTSAMGAASTAQFARFYISPGVGHCAGGPGAEPSDLLATLDSWVSNGAAPGTLEARNADSGITRPLCQYPAYPHYIGTGSLAHAANYVCRTP